MLPVLTPSSLGLEGYDAGFRDVQLEVLNYMEQGQEAFLAIESPTGTGKSLIAVAHQKQTGARVRILTRTISLMQQYMRDFSSHAVTMKGRGNFPCVWDEANSDTAANAPCTDGINCPVRSICPYYIQRGIAEAHPLVVTSYAYYFAETMFASGDVSECDVLICDEAHRLRDILDDLFQVQVRREEWERLDSMPVEDTLPLWGESAARALQMLELDKSVGDKKWRQKMRRKARSVLWYAKSAEPHIIYSMGGTVFFSPLWPKLTHVPIRAEQVVFLSGTLYGGKHFADMLGIPEEQYSFISLPSPFNVDRRPVYIEPVVAMNARTSEADYMRMAEHIKGVWARHPGQKGMIHVNSNAQAAAIYSALGREHVILHCGEQGEDRQRLFEQFRSAPRGTYLLSPSAGEGEDFPNEQCRVNIIAKVPYPYLGDPLVSARMNDGPFGKKDYAAQTVMQISQMIGRAMRSEADWGATYVLDSNVRNLLKFNRPLWPDYILAALR